MKLSIEIEFYLNMLRFSSYLGAFKSKNATCFLHALKNTSFACIVWQVLIKTMVSNEELQILIKIYNVS